jgi:hypothetical protein
VPLATRTASRRPRTDQRQHGTESPPGRCARLPPRKGIPPTPTEQRRRAGAVVRGAGPSRGHAAGSLQFVQQHSSLLARLGAGADTLDGVLVDQRRDQRGGAVRRAGGETARPSTSRRRNRGNVAMDQHTRGGRALLVGVAECGPGCPTASSDPHPKTTIAFCRPSPPRSRAGRRVPAGCGCPRVDARADAAGP